MSGPIRGGNGKPPATNWEDDDAPRFRRPRQPVEVRRRAPWKRALKTTGSILLLLVVLGAVGGAGLGAYRFAATGALFRVAAETVEVANAERVPATAVRELFAADVGGSVFAVPLEARRQSLEEIVWVEGATVERLLPNRLRVHIRERTPVAFLRQGASLWLVDSDGVVLSLPEGASYAFPVLSGLPETLSREERAARVRLYLEFVGDLDRDGKGYSARFSEIDLSDTDDIRATVTETDGAVWLHFGRERYQEKFDAYLQHQRLWQESGETVRSVDLRYRGQIVLNPDSATRSSGR